MNEGVLTLDELRANAQRFVNKWVGESRERAEKDSFWNDFLGILGINRRQVARFEHLAKRYSTGRHGFIDMFWPGRLLVEHKSLGANMAKAMAQALDYLPGMDEAEVPRLVTVSDFDFFTVRDLDLSSEITFELRELPKNIELFGSLIGRERRHRFETEVDVNLAATRLLTRFHDALRDSGYDDHQRRILLTRVLFCLFADDAQVWIAGLFQDFLLLRTRSDGSDLGPQLSWLFQVLNTPKTERSPALPEDLSDFRYINGGLFAETLPMPACNREMRNALIGCSKFNWSRISPAIFGSMFQNVMTPVERRSLGAHYTTEENILKTLGPLFLDDLKAELDRAESLPALVRYRDQLARLTFFDPACGCGNFLVIAYREIRRLELTCLRKIRIKQKTVDQRTFNVSIESNVHVGQFYGIEIGEFPCRIAEAALHLMDHLANLELSEAFGQYYVRFPITDTAHILNANAIRVDWNDLLPASGCSFVFGNPPFVGMYLMNAEQQDDNRIAFAEHGGAKARTGRLDYVACWYAKTWSYLSGCRGRAAFVSTNSITQGEQVRSLGPLMLSRRFTIDFAHRTFAWSSEAKGSAKVHVVIVGFSQGDGSGRLRLFEYPSVIAAPVERRVSNINNYLAAGPSVIPAKRTRPLSSSVPPCIQGNKPWDGGALIVERDDLELVAADSRASKYLRRLYGARELLQGLDRWCLWLVDADPADLRQSPVLRERLIAVRDIRKATKTASVREKAATPALFSEIRQPSVDFLAIPQTSSSNRRYLPAKFLRPSDIVTNGIFMLPGAGIVDFGYIQSAMFMTWAQAVSGRLKNDIQLAPGTVYNTFPFPDIPATRRESIAAAADRVLEARAAHSESSLADLYDPLTMPLDLVRAHRELDRSVDASFGRRKVTTDGERLSTLFEYYVRLSESGSSAGGAC